MGNPFDRFDKGNPFDRFDAPAAPVNLAQSPKGTLGGYDPVTPLPDKRLLGSSLKELTVDPKALADAKGRQAKDDQRGTRPARKASPGYSEQSAVSLDQAAQNNDRDRALLNNMYLGFVDDGVGAANGLKTGLLNMLGAGPGYSGKEASDAAKVAFDSRQTAYEVGHPVDSLVHNLAGGLASPANFVGGALIGKGPLLPTITKGAAVGAGIGAVAGAGNADGGIAERAIGAGEGAAVGAAVGGAAPVVARGLSIVGAPLLKGAGGAVSELADGAKRLATGSSIAEQARVPNPRQAAKATQKGAEYIARMGATPDKLRAAALAAEGKPITSAEAIGQNAIGQVAGMSRRAGQTPELAEGILSQRSQQRADRILTDVAETTGINPAGARGDVEALVQAGQDQARPLYTAALQNAGPITAPVFDDLASRPVIKKAISSAAEEVLNRGGNPSEFGFVATVEKVPGGGTRTVYDKVLNPTAETWDLVKKSVGRQVERSPITGRPLPDSQSAGNTSINVASRDLTSAMREYIPGYADALNVSGDYLSVGSAYDRSKGMLLNLKTNAGDFANYFNGLGSEAEKNAARSRIANDVYELAQNGRLNPRLFNTPAVKQKLAVAFGEDNANRIAMRLQIEAKMAAAESRMRPNQGSVTGDVLGQGEAERAAMGDAAIKAGTSLMLGNPKAAGMSLLSPLQSAVRGARTGENQFTRDEVGRLLLEVPPDELAAYLESLPKDQTPGIMNYLAPAAGRLPVPLDQQRPNN